MKSPCRPGLRPGVWSTAVLNISDTVCARFCMLALLLAGAGARGAEKSAVPPAPQRPALARPGGVRPGIEMLAAQHYEILRNKRVGLLTHVAAVNRAGQGTAEVLWRAPGVRLVALFGPEHGYQSRMKAFFAVGDQHDPLTGLPVYSLYGERRRPTAEMLAKIDVLVIDLQDIGVRYYTYISAMRYAMEACFQAGVEVVVLDRPNPLGGLKVDGPGVDAALISYVGAFNVPVVHGLTIGELALMAASEPGMLAIPDNVRRRGRLRVVQMGGWRRSFRWPETGLRWVPPSPNIPSYQAMLGYAMTGVGTQVGGIENGYGGSMPYGILKFGGTRPVVDLEEQLVNARIPGLHFALREFTDKSGRKQTGLAIEIANWQTWRPAELNFHLMRIACVLNRKNPFTQLTKERALLLNKHIGSQAWWNALMRDGEKAPVKTFVERWSAEALRFQQRSRIYWLYPE